MRTSIKKIGNSKGVVIPPAFLSELNLDRDSAIDIDMVPNGILIRKPLNPRDDWEAMFKKELSLGEAPEGDLFEDLSNDFDENEWTW